MVQWLKQATFQHPHSFDSRPAPFPFPSDVPIGWKRGRGGHVSPNPSLVCSSGYAPSLFCLLSSEKLSACTPKRSFTREDPSVESKLTRRT